MTPMEKTINKGLLEHAAGTHIFCPRCRQIMDCRRTVLVTFTQTNGGMKTWTMCAACYDRIKLELHDLVLGMKGTLDVVDGREVFARAPRTRKATTAVQEVQ
jgi:hypothetical protein